MTARNRRFFDPRSMRPVANYAPANYRIDGRAPTADPDLTMSAPHDWSGFDNFFHPQPKTAPPAAPASAAAKAPVGPSTIPAAPKDANGSVVQGLLDRAAGVKTPTTTQSQPPNPGAVARQTGEQQQTKYGTVGVNRVTGTPDGTPIMQNGVQTGIAGNPVQGPPAPTAADNARSLVATRSATLNRFPAIAQAGTPENAAFVAFAKSTNPETGQPYGEAGAHANLDKLMKPFLVGPPTPTESDVAASQYAQQKADQAKAAAGNFDPNSKLGKAAIAINTAPGPVDWAKDQANKLAKSVGYQKPLFTPSSDQKPYTAINPNDSDLRDDQEYLKNLPPGAGEEHFTNGHYDPSKDPDVNVPAMTPEQSKAVAARAQSSLPMDHDDDEPAKLLAPSSTPSAAPSQPSGPPAPYAAPYANKSDEAWDERINNMNPDTVSDAAVNRSFARESGAQIKASPAPVSGPPAPSTPDQVTQQKVNALNNGQALEDSESHAQNDKDVAAFNQPISPQTPNYARGFRPKPFTPKTVPNYADGGVGGGPSAGSGDADEINLGNNMRRADSVDNEFHPLPGQSMGGMPSVQQPTSSPTNAERAEANSWKGDMQAAQGALENYNKTQGDPNQGTTTQQLAGPDGPIASVPGKPIVNYARGRVPAYAKGRPLFAPAMKREAKAIAAGVGGAPRSAKPEPVVLAGQPAVINSSEQVVPNAAGGYPAVLNRNMQRKMKRAPFVPSRS